MADPSLLINLEKIEHNARHIVSLCAAQGINVVGVTKVTCGDPQVARAMLSGGVAAIGESRMVNIARLQSAGVKAKYQLLRIPSLSRAKQIVACVDSSLNSELAVVSALSAAAETQGTRHRIIVMVDLGDLREGVWPDQLLSFVDRCGQLRGVIVQGIGTNLSCLSGVVPTSASLQQLVACAEQVESLLGYPLEVISGGASNLLPLIAAGDVPARINHVRVGEAILLGRETIRRTALPDTFQDAFTLRAEVIEVKRKPSMPVGELSEDAFGHHPRFTDRGDIDRAIVNIGRADIDTDNVQSEDSRFTIIGASSDHLLLDVTAAGGTVRVGDSLQFRLGYSALLAAMLSPYVEKRYSGS